MATFGSRLLALLLCAAWAQPVLGAESLVLVPSTFDFGWAPDNAVLNCDIRVRNLGGEMIPLTAVQPSCGCTATDFTPEGLPASEETKIHLAFNTRGYANVRFDKGVKVKAGMPEKEYTVRLVGAVVDPSAKVLPEGDGIAAFVSTGSSKTSLLIRNRTDKPVELAVVQEPAGWVQLKLPRAPIPANGTAALEVKVKGPLSETRQSSATFEASDGAAKHRFTVAIRTGEPPQPYRRLRVAPKSVPESPTATPPAQP